MHEQRIVQCRDAYGAAPGWSIRAEQWRQHAGLGRQIEQIQVQHAGLEGAAPAEHVSNGARPEIFRPCVDQMVGGGRYRDEAVVPLGEPCQQTRQAGIRGGER